ncbi:MAG: prepilin peptidase [Candidatus Rokuibacteriota bacterium]|nr:MAG: prepilin peptidase [Candidatus Rokubacteria bacterium]
MLAAAVVIGIFGLAVGSFLNVCIARLPEGKSLWWPGSACPHCGAAIGWRDNVPVLSYVALRGRCRACGGPIAWRYPLVEVVTSGLFVLTVLRLGWTPELAIGLALVAALIVVTGIDLLRQIIPDVITVPGIVFGFLTNSLAGRVSWLDSLLGILAGGGIFFAIILVSKGGMGGGDMKLGAMLGAFLGWKVALISLLIAVLSGGGVAAVLLLTRARGRKDPVPFGPFLALGGLAGLLWGEILLAWYLGTFGR